jgi:hypothetical protein
MRNIPFEAQTSTWQNCILEVPSNWAQGILFDHMSGGSQFFHSLSPVDLSIKDQLFAKWEIRPICSLGGVGVVGIDQALQDFGLVALRWGANDGGMVIAGFRIMRSTEYALVDWIVVVMVVESHLVGLALALERWSPALLPCRLVEKCCE